MDRNAHAVSSQEIFRSSLSARRAWIEIIKKGRARRPGQSLSARRAWIEIAPGESGRRRWLVALRKESVDRNVNLRVVDGSKSCRSPQGERG